MSERKAKMTDKTICLNSKGNVKTNLRIRKLTPYECGKLMGFDRCDFERMSEAGLPEWVLYHSAGDSIVTTVLMGIFGEILDIDYEKAIKNVAKRISEEKKCSTR